MSTALHVVEHRLDESENVYRLVVGYPVTTFTPAHDEHGDPIYDEDPILDPDGKPLMTREHVHSVDRDGNDVFTAVEKPAVMKRQRMIEEIIGYDRTTEFVFHADDPKWKGKSPQKIADAQRALALAAVQPNEPAPAPEPPEGSLPGVGDPLA